MNQFDLIEYLKKGSSKYIDYLETPLKIRLTFFGDHFANNNEKESIKYIIYLLKQLFIFIAIKFFFNKKFKNSNINVCSNSYFKLHNDLNKLGYNTYTVPWDLNNNPTTLTISEFVILQFFKYKLHYSSFIFLRSNIFSDKIDKIEKLLVRNFKRKNIKAIFLSNDTGFFERLAIQIAKNNNIKTFILMHGAGTRYANNKLDNRTDYYLVFGEIIKHNFVKCGFNNDQVVVIGHPILSKERIKYPSFKFSLDRIVVISKTIPGILFQINYKLKGRELDTMKIANRSNSILYLEMIKDVLKYFNVKEVILRLHPSENKSWYSKYIDSEFFIFDNDNIINSFNKASLIIGPTSTSLVDALSCGINYTIFEPQYEGNIDITNQAIGHPFDGSDNRVPVAKDINELKNIISKKKSIDPAFFEDLIQKDFDINLLRKLISND